MARLNIGLLSEQQQQEQVPEVEIDQNNEALKTDQDMVEIQSTGSEIEEISQVVEETQDASQTMTNMADKIEQSETVSQDTVQVAQEAIAYFVKRTGVKMTKLNASMESYSKTTDKQAVVEQMRLATESLNKGVAVAQEGIIDRIKNRFSLIFTSSAKLRKELKEVSNKYDQNGAKEEVLVNPAFARRLNLDEKALLKETDVVALVTEIDKKVHNPKLIESVKALTQSINKVNQALSKSGMFLADKGSIEEIQAQQDIILNIYNEMSDGFAVSRQKNNADIEPLSAANKAKVVKLVDSLLDIGAYERYEDMLSDAVDKLQSTIYSNRNTKVTSVILKMDSADTANAEQASDYAYQVYRVISNLMALRFDLAHACVKYIKASTK